MAFKASKVITTKEHTEVSLKTSVRGLPLSERDVSKRFVKQKSYDNAVVVNGRQKQISKKSAFLLDMLTLDDE